LVKVIVASPHLPEATNQPDSPLHRHDIPASFDLVHGLKLLIKTFGASMLS